MVAYHSWYPTVSLEGLFEGTRKVGIADNQAMPLDQATPHWVAFTGNSDTPYVLGVLDVKDGPIAVELPAGAFVSLVDDHHQRWVVDVGIPGRCVTFLGRMFLENNDPKPPVELVKSRTKIYPYEVGSLGTSVPNS